MKNKTVANTKRITHKSRNVGCFVLHVEKEEREENQDKEENNSDEKIFFGKALRLYAWLH
ncbi:hypothetical protein NECAME_14831 [Necator americanus]|uniref:Uncharacterized protein n=1 Tax=Necator americanus TaxID=51031 RepID=W2SLD4_NECAM|nr:hypothetical protein NECAME_14831 [Necator americanus]ETN70338.1 hypothetical protein NECAME_14831 [Necator americanus]